MAGVEVDDGLVEILVQDVRDIHDVQQADCNRLAARAPVTRLFNLDRAPCSSLASGVIVGCSATVRGGGSWFGS
jgi:hypothetical protein